MKGKKIVNALLSITMSFLIILIVALFSRSVISNVLPASSKVSIFMNDYLNMMVRKVDMLALKFNVKRNTVTQYQVDLITQSIEDYVNYSMYQTSSVVSDFISSKQPTSKELDKYKNSYYKMTLENPYIKSLTVFSMNGNMLLNLYLSGNKSWPYEIEGQLANTVSKDGYIVLNASNENSFYIFQHVKNKNGEFIVATRNDYVFVSDIAHYYQVADKTFYVSDSRNEVYAVLDGESPKSIENATSIINKFAFYKKQPSFSVGRNNALSVALIGLEYPNYFEFIVLVITALCIVILKSFIQLILSFLKLLIFGRNNSEVAMPKDVPLIDEEIITGKKKPLFDSKEIDFVSAKDDKNDIEKELEELENRVRDIETARVPIAKNESPDYKELNLNTIEKEESSINNIKGVDIVVEESIDKGNIYKEDKEEYVSNEDNVIVVKDLNDIEENTIAPKELQVVKEIPKIKLPDTNPTKPKSNEELFAAFDNMLASIISKVESETRDSLTKRN